MIRLILLVLLILNNWTVSYAQIGSNDTLLCYTIEEARAIAAKLIKANECQELLNICSEEVDALNDYAEIQDSIITNKTVIIAEQTDHIERKQNKIEELNTTIETQETQKKWLKIGWIGTSAALTFGLLLSLLK